LKQSNTVSHRYQKSVRNQLQQSEGKIMQILAISELTKNSTLENVTPHIAQEVRDTLGLHLKDVIRSFYFQSEGNGVVFMMECDSVEAARSELDNLILVKNGIAQFRLIPLEPLRPLGMLLKNVG
jgi:hypothetical protein